MLGICFHLLLENALWLQGRQFIPWLKLCAFLLWGPVCVELSPVFPGLDLCTWLWVLMTSVATAAKLAEYLARVLGRGEGRELLPEVWIILNSGTTCKTFTSCYSLKLYSTSKRTHIILIQVNFLAIQMVYYTT